MLRTFWDHREFHGHHLKAHVATQIFLYTATRKNVLPPFSTFSLMTATSFTYDQRPTDHFSNRKPPNAQRRIHMDHAQATSIHRVTYPHTKIYNRLSIEPIEHTTTTDHLNTIHMLRKRRPVRKHNEYLLKKCFRCNHSKRRKVKNPGEALLVGLNKVIVRNLV